YLVLTDSGGIQEEAPSFGKPVLVMRETTERPEAVRAGTAEVVGTDRKNIIAKVNQLLNSKTDYDKMVNGVNPFGDGKAARRIVKVLFKNCKRSL
ncbi:UDP-N-acetylglucosamine 2-epimerase, partial [Candidatus Pacearchaeota archaeon]|nr:UDP-N-acetylglucosamine 2-epimerase [Candidatus Pacearchaeota archaeon]